MAVSMEDVKKLRDLSSAGMMDCKKSLEQTNGNIEEALKILKEKGLADAKKRSDRETKEGGVYIKKDKKCKLDQFFRGKFCIGKRKRLNV